MAAAFPPATKAGIAAAKKGAIPPRCLPTPGLRFLANPCRRRRFVMVNEELANGTPFYILVKRMDLRLAFSFG